VSFGHLWTDCASIDAARLRSAPAARQPPGGFQQELRNTFPRPIPLEQAGRLKQRWHFVAEEYAGTRDLSMSLHGAEKGVHS
jgi:hypothetical protein